jgi:long-subunit acyl-CoA synthetase (AMP-forming)
MIHGGNVALGYFQNEEKTKEDFINIDGKIWFATGDIGEFRPDGSLNIIGEKHFVAIFYFSLFIL